VSHPGRTQFIPIEMRPCEPPPDPTQAVPLAPPPYRQRIWMRCKSALSDDLQEHQVHIQTRV
jgi:hypothetical protein